MRDKLRLFDQSYALGNMRVLPSLLQLVSVKADSTGLSAAIDWKETQMCFIFSPFSPPQLISHVSPTNQGITKGQIQFIFDLHLQSLHHPHCRLPKWQMSIQLGKCQPERDKVIKLLGNAMVTEPCPQQCCSN